MNKDFFKVTALVLLVIVSIGFIAWLIPGLDAGFLHLKPLKWFGWLKSSPDTLSVVVDEQALKQAEQWSHATKPLQSFLTALPGAKSGSAQIRIAYFGDSIIEGDLITQRLRYNLQNRFGGSGIGFVPITSIVSEFRKTIRHTFARNWESLSFMSPNKAEYPLGISGYVFIPRNWYTVQKALEVQSDSLADSTATFAPDTSQTVTKRYYVDTPPWVSYQAVNVNGGARQFDRIRLFYSHAQSGEISVEFDGNPERSYGLLSGDGLQTFDLSQGSPVKQLSLTAPFTNPAHFYGFSFDQPAGVFVDNFAIRGFSGMYFQRIPKPLLEQFQSRLQYDLIVLQYGENVSNPKLRNYDFYRDGMIKTIRYLQSAFPDVPILLISAHDRSIKTASGYVTSPDIPYLIKAQAETAEATGCAFWNLYEAMGGKDSMQKFVKNVPPLASKDYTHFNLAGANRIADLLTDFILGGK
jgi:lysophospholipase L1-like esterase